ncbi:MAG: pantothenate kinase, partial [Clostridiaceae bacterium]|nr:pantothenate kinase [Clostridiaceae bacterium]
HQGNIYTLSDMAMNGNRAMADLRIGDLVNEDVPTLNSDLTASNFGKIKSGATDDDMAAALFNMIYENIGVMAVLALRGDTTRDVVLTGSLACLPPAEVTFSVFNRMKDVFGVNFILPPHAAFATAIGSLL